MTKKMEVKHNKIPTMKFLYAIITFILVAWHIMNCLIVSLIDANCNFTVQFENSTVELVALDFRKYNKTGQSCQYVSYL